jgi:hypothetical protein
MVRPFVLRGRGAAHGGREGAAIAAGLEAAVSFCICSLFDPEEGDPVQWLFLPGRLNRQ